MQFKHSEFLLPFEIIINECLRVKYVSLFGSVYTLNTRVDHGPCLRAVDTAGRVYGP